MRRAARVAVDELRFEMGFEQRHVAGDHRVRHVQTHRRAVERAVLGNADEHAHGLKLIHVFGGGVGTRRMGAAMEKNEVARHAWRSPRGDSTDARWASGMSSESMLYPEFSVLSDCNVLSGYRIK